VENLAVKLFIYPGFSSEILEDLNSWVKDLKIIVDAMVDHAAGSQMDKPRFEEWVSRDLTPLLMQNIDPKIPSQRKTCQISGKI